MDAKNKFHAGENSDGLASNGLASGGQGRIRLDFLDGIRGLVALYVVVFHLAGEHQGEYIPPTIWTQWLSFGHVGVGIFIVLSGYCLMLPVARSSEGTLRGGVMAFLRRRALRIFPPYYAALVLTLLMIAVSQIVKHVPLQGANSGWNVFNPVNLVLHVLMLHNLSYDWQQAIDPPMWSVGLEWQIYFLFPLLLIFWRRFGSLRTVLLATVISSLPQFIFPQPYRFDYICLWYVGLFAMGMAAASIGFSTRATDIALRLRTPWLLLGGLFGIATLLTLMRFDYANFTFRCLNDLLLGPTVSCFLIAATRIATRIAMDSSRPKSRILAMLNSGPCIGLGNFSYSLYLIHLPAWWLIQPLMRKFHLVGKVGFCFELFVGVPAVVAIAYLFHLTFERPFLSSHPGNVRTEVLHTATENSTNSQRMAA